MRATTVRIVRSKAKESIRGRFSFSEWRLPVDNNSCKRPDFKAATDGVSARWRGLPVGGRAHDATGSNHGHGRHGSARQGSLAPPLAVPFQATSEATIAARNSRAGGEQRIDAPPRPDPGARARQ